MASEETSKVIVQPADKAHIKHIWKVAGILALITAFEFLVAFTMDNSVLKVSIFILMTLVKAFYIVGEFMHLKHEVKTLIWSVLVPMTFVVWLIIVLLYEGDAILLGY